MRACFIPNMILFTTAISALRNPTREVGGEDPADEPIGPPPQLFPWGYAEQVLDDPPSEEQVAAIQGINSNEEVPAELRRAAVSMMRYFHELGVVRLEGTDLRAEAGLRPLEERVVTEEVVDIGEDSDETAKEDSGERQGEDGESEDEDGNESDADSVAGSERAHTEFGPGHGNTDGGVEESNGNVQRATVTEEMALIDRPSRVGGVMAVPMRFRLAPNMTMDDVPTRLRRIRVPLGPGNERESRRGRTVPEMARGSNGKWFVCGRSPL